MHLKVSILRLPTSRPVKSLGTLRRLLSVLPNYLPEFFLECSPMLGLFYEPTDLPPGAVVDDDCRDTEYIHLVGYVPVLVEVDHFDI